MLIRDCALRLSFPYTIFTDGAAKGKNGQGPASSGFVVYDREGKLYSQAKTIGVHTNNYAEYVGLLMALDWVISNIQQEMRCVHFKTDSQLMEKQINGEYGVKHDEIIRLYSQAVGYLGSLDAYKVEWVRREFNQEADAACNAAIKHGQYEWTRNDQHNSN